MLDRATSGDAQPGAHPDSLIHGRILTQFPGTHCWSASQVLHPTGSGSRLNLIEEQDHPSLVDWAVFIDSEEIFDRLTLLSRA